MGEDQFDDLQLNGLITFGTLDEIAWDFNRAKMMDVMKDLEINFELLPPQPSRKSGQSRKKKKTKVQYYAKLELARNLKISWI